MLFGSTPWRLVRVRPGGPDRSRRAAGSGAGADLPPRQLRLLARAQRLGRCGHLLAAVLGASTSRVHSSSAMARIVGRDEKPKNTARSPVAATASSTAKVFPAPAWPWTTPLAPAAPTSATARRQQFVVLALDRHSVEIQEVPAHQLVANPSVDTERTPSADGSEASLSWSTVAASASAVAVAAGSR